MSLLNNSNAISTGGGYNLENSLRFRSSASAYLNRTPTVASNRKTFTISLWMKGSLESSPALFQARESSSTGQPHFVLQSSNGSLYILDQNAGTQAQIITTAVFRDPSAWYHIVVAIDTTEAIAADRAKIYVNSEKLESFSTLDTFPLNYDTAVNNTVRHLVGARMPNSSFALIQYLDGYLTEVNFVDGQALTPSDFGEYNEDTGVWQPIEYEGTYGTNGFYLKGRGTDNSGNGNNFTETNFNTTNSALTTYDIMTDVPTLTDEDTANYCTLNPLRYAFYPGNAAVTLSEANLKATWSGDPGTLISTINIPTTGKWYWEAVVPTQTFNFFAVGVVKNQETTNLNNFAGTSGYAVYAYNGLKYILGTGSAYMAIPAQNTVITVAFDADTGSLYVGAGGSWANGSGSTNQTFSNAAEVVTGLTGDISPAFSFNSGSFIVNFGQRPFTYTPPTGYLKLNTFNLPDSSIVDGSENFGVGLWTGTGSVTAPNIPSVTNLKFKPEFLWSKSRSTVANNYLYDIVRSPGDSPNKFLGSNTTDVEQTFNAFTLTDTGFNLATTNVYFNQASATYVAWNWKAGGTAVSNTDGTITSSVSANPTAGFSVLTYTGTGGTKTVGHGLGVAPQMVIVKGRNGGTNWVVYHVGMGATKYMLMNTTSAAATDSTPWNNTSPTSTVVSLGTSSNTNGNTAPFVAYCFAEVEGYSKFGSYTGNGSTDGPFVYTGFRPAFVMIKNSSVGSGGYDWVMIDTSRSTYNIQSASLSANLSSAEYTGTLVGIDILSNGFKSRVTNAAINGNGNKMIYMAFAENPFKNSLAR